MSNLKLPKKYHRNPIGYMGIGVMLVLLSLVVFMGFSQAGDLIDSLIRIFSAIFLFVGGMSLMILPLFRIPFIEISKDKKVMIRRTRNRAIRRSVELDIKNIVSSQVIREPFGSSALYIKYKSGKKLKDLYVWPTEFFHKSDFYEFAAFLEKETKLS